MNSEFFVTMPSKKYFRYQNNVVCIIILAFSLAMTVRVASAQEVSVPWSDHHVPVQTNRELEKNEKSTLFNLIEEGINHNHSLKQALYQVESQKLNLSKSRMGYLPSVNLSVQRDKQWTSQELPSMSLLSSSNQFVSKGANLDMSWNIFDGGMQKALVGEANENLNGAIQGERVARQTSIFAIVKNYYEITAKLAMLDEINASFDRTEETLQITTEKARLGVISIFDVLQSRNALTSAEKDRLIALNDIEKSKASLNLALGLPLKKPIPISKLNVTEEFLADMQRMDSWEAKNTVIDSPDVLYAQAQLRVFEARAKQVDAQLKPSVSIGGTLNRNSDPLTVSLGSPLVPSESYYKSLYVKLTIPIPDGRGQFYQQSIARHEIEKQREVIAETREKLELENFNDLSSLDLAEKMVRSNLEAAKINQESYDAAMERYKLGTETITTLLSVQNALSSSRISVTSSVLDLLNVRASIIIKNAEQNKKPLYELVQALNVDH